MILYINDRIRNRKVQYFNQFKLDLSYDSVASAFSFNYYYDPDNKEHRELSCVSHYHLVNIEHDNELFLSGMILSQTFKDARELNMAAINGYSLPGVLEDCNIPTSAYPLQSDGLTLLQIVKRFTAPWDYLKIVVDPAVASRMNKVLATTTAEPTQKVKDYLTEICSQENIVISHTAKGELYFTEVKTNQVPVIHFEKGMIGVEMDMVYAGQQIYSHITVIKQAGTDGGNAGEFTIENPLCPIVYRPKVIVQSSGDDNDTEKVARAELAAELKNCKIVINVDRWNLNNKLIKPNTIIEVTNPKIYLFKKTQLFVESVSYAGDNAQMTAQLTCVLPEAYNNQKPINVFVSDHFKQNG